MAILGDLLGRSSSCTNPCGDVSSPTDQDECFGHLNTNLEEPSCDDWANGFQDCNGKPTINLLAKINWLWNKITCAIKGIDERVTALEGITPITSWVVDDSDGDGVYQITIGFSDGTTDSSQTIEDTDTRLTNPVPQDTDTNGIFDQILWQVVDDDGNVVGTVVEPVQENNSVSNIDITDSDNDGVYDVLITYLDGSTSSETFEDTDTRLTNPTPQDTNSNGINDQVVWDVVDDDGNIVGNVTQPIQEYVQNTNTGLTFNNTSRVLTLTQAFGGTLTATIPSGDTDTNTFLNTINGNSAGGLINPNANNQFVFVRNNGTSWILQLGSGGGALIALVETGTTINSSLMSGSSGVGHSDDPNGVFSFSGGQVTVNRTGRYIITSQAVSLSNLGGYMDAAIIVNGSPNFQNAAASYPNNRIFQPRVGEVTMAICMRKLNAGDVVRLGAFYTAGSGSGAWGEGGITYLGD